MQLVQCRRIQSIRLGIESKNFHKLELVNLDKLKRLHINSNSLTYLNISGCRLLTDDSALITCPSLKVLDICGTFLSNNFYTDDLERCVVKRGHIELPSDFDDMMIYI